MNPNSDGTIEIDGRGDSWIQTVSGRKFHVFDPRPEDVDLEDIAHALSNLCRFSGHTSSFYSVAEHAVHVAETVYLITRDAGLALAALHHDDGEAYTGDFPSPWKKLILVNLPEGLVPFKTCEDRITYAVFRALAIDGVLRPAGGEPLFNPAVWDVVKKYDKMLLATEACDLMRGAAHCHWRHSLDPAYPPLGFTICPLPPLEAGGVFLDRHRMFSSQCRRPG